MLTPSTVEPGGSVRGRVLVAEDDDTLRDLVAQALREEGYAVACAADGAEAFTLLHEAMVRQEPRFDLVLLDWRMPVPGPVFVERYRQLPLPRPPIVVVSGGEAGGEAVVDTTLQADARGFLRKPFDLDELSELVGRLVPAALQTSGPADRGATAHRATDLHVRQPSPFAAQERRRRATVEAATQKGEQRRRQALTRLQEDVARVQASVARTRQHLQGLLEQAQARHLTPVEAQQVRTLRWEHEKLHHELGQLREWFETLRAARG